jgi:bilin biosynthesis protein
MVNNVANANRFDNLHPGLSQDEALRILALPVDQLESGSDRYMATSHLINFPGERSEQALLNLLEENDESQPTRLAKRKAVEVLARLGCTAALDSIGVCLFSKDRYLVENAAWAMQQLGCQDPAIQNRMITLLEDPDQNRRVLAQSLAGLGVKNALPAIAALQDDESPGVRGAALAAVATLNGENERISELAEHLFLPNQMDRQSAIQDVINAEAVHLLGQVLRAPVSPVFRLRALRLLWPGTEPQNDELSLLETLDTLFWDHPDSVSLVHRYDETPENIFLIDELFGTDFSRCYLALQTLASCVVPDLWPLLEKRWLEDAHNDYGAHYFFLRLFGQIGDWGDVQAMVEDLCESAIHNRRPQFLKSRPAGILALLRVNPSRLRPLLRNLMVAEVETNWECRYAALMAYQTLLREGTDLDAAEKAAILSTSDPDLFVECKRSFVESLIADL